MIVNYLLKYLIFFLLISLVLDRSLSSFFSKWIHTDSKIEHIIVLEKIYPKRWYGSNHINYFLYNYYLTQSNLDKAYCNIVKYVDDVPYDLDAKIELLLTFSDNYLQTDDLSTALEIFEVQNNRHGVGLYLIQYYIEKGDLVKAKFHFEHIWGNHNWLNLGYRPEFTEDELDKLFEYHNFFKDLNY